MISLVKNKLKNKKGEVSILFVILAITLVIYITGNLKLFEEQYAIDEIQSIMDTTGVSTLEKVIDFRILKDEMFGIDINNKMELNEANKILNNYEEQIRREYRNKLKFNKNLIDSWEIKVQDIYFENSSWGKSDVSPQIILETILTVKLKAGIGTDTIANKDNSFYSGKKGSSIEIMTAGVANDGLIELTLRSTVRTVYIV